MFSIFQKLLSRQIKILTISANETQLVQNGRRIHLLPKKKILLDTPKTLVQTNVCRMLSLSSINNADAFCPCCRCSNECGDAGLVNLYCGSAILTGGCGGIGYHMLIYLVESGVKRIAILDTDECNGKMILRYLQEYYGMDQAMFIKCDCSSEAELENAFCSVHSTFKKIDILVNNAAQIQEDKWRQVFMTNVYGCYKCNVLGLRYMSLSTCGCGGTIVNISSIQGIDPCEDVPAFSASGGAIISMTRCFGSEFYYNRHGVRFMCLCPGFTCTSFNDTSSWSSSVSKECYEKQKATLPWQYPWTVAGALKYMLLYGMNGSVWVCEGSDLYPIEFPERACLRSKTPCMHTCGAPCGPDAPDPPCPGEAEPKSKGILASLLGGNQDK